MTSTLERFKKRFGNDLEEDFVSDLVAFIESEVSAARKEERRSVLELIAELRRTNPYCADEKGYALMAWEDVEKFLSPTEN